MSNVSKRMRFVCIVAALLLLLPVSAGYAHPVSYLVVEVEQGPIPIYASPSLNAQVLREIGRGNRFLWSGVRQVGTEGRQWMQIVVPPNLTGWMSPNDGALFLADPTRITLNADRSVILTPVTNPMTLYGTPGRGSPVLATLAVGQRLRVADGPVVTDLYTWWPVQVEGTTLRGWVVDTGRELQALTSLQVYGYQVCDNFNLKVFGVAGWDSVLPTMRASLTAGEQVVCLASTNLLGNSSPVVVVLTRAESAQGSRDALRLFVPSGGGWAIAFQQFTDPFTRTDRLSLHAFPPDNLPMLYWGTRNDGTGDILNAQFVRYTAGGFQPVLTGQYYKGQLQVGEDGVTFIEADYLPNEPNCCPSGVRRAVFGWDGIQFRQIINEVLPAPFAFQSRR